MKNNLKNRPTWKKEPYGKSSPSMKDFDEWFEGFEAELREKQHPHNSGWLSDKSCPYCELIKEILGESEDH